jgi:hypothetical protein
MRITLFALVAAASAALANDTALHDGRFGPEPLGETESPVRMVAEHIEVAFGYQLSKVHCTFTFRNTEGSGTVEQLIGFPDSGAAAEKLAQEYPSERDYIFESAMSSPLRNLRTLVDGEPRETALQFVKLPGNLERDGTLAKLPNGRGALRAWHTARVSFPAGRDVMVERSYTLQNGTTMPPRAFFEYTTRTGAEWKGTIGRCQVDVTLLDGVTAEALIWPGSPQDGEQVPDDPERFAMSPSRAGWQILDPTHLRLVWTDFEPRTQADRRGFCLSRPFRGWSDPAP